MKQNITLSIEKGLIKKGRILAAQRDSSISKMVGELPKEIVDSESRYEAAKKRAVQHLKQGFSLGGKVSWKREDLYGGR